MVDCAPFKMSVFQSLFTALERGAIVSKTFDKRTPIPRTGDGAAWVKIAASGGTDIADSLNEKVQGFVFLLLRSDADILGWTIEDLTEEETS